MSSPELPGLAINVRVVVVRNSKDYTEYYASFL